MELSSRDQDPFVVPKRLRIGLALSGGGFRATMFHLGVVRFLADADLLRGVKHICSVSGGSILAAHLGLKWESYVNSTSFNNVAGELIEFVENGVRERIVHRMPLYYPMSYLPWMRDWNLTRVLQSMYSGFFGNKALTALARSTVPQIHLLATNLTKPTEAFCFCASGCESHPSGHQNSRLGPGGLPLARAVAASSAFPGLFPPLQLWAQDIGVKQGQLGSAWVYLTDGGVFDNLGVRALDELNRREHLDLMFASDAGARPDSQFDVHYLRSWTTVPRVVEIMGERMRALESGKGGVSDCSIHSTTVPGTVDPQIRQALGAVRTDLDSFSRLLIWSLICHGYDVAKAAMMKTIDERAHAASIGSQDQADASQELREWKALEKVVQATSTWKPYEKEPSTGNTADDLKRIQGDEKRQWKLHKFTNDYALLVSYLAFAGVLVVGSWKWGPDAWSAIRYGTAAVLGLKVHESLPTFNQVEIAKLAGALNTQKEDLDAGIAIGKWVVFKGKVAGELTDDPSNSYIDLRDPDDANGARCHVILNETRAPDKKLLGSSVIVIGRVEAEAGPPGRWVIRDPNLFELEKVR